MKLSKIDIKKFTKDAFLGGRIQAFQPKIGFRSSMEAVFLAASIPAKENQAILELGCGAGVVLMCLNCRVPNLNLYGVEIQKKYADLAQINLDQNSNVRTYHSDIQDLPLEIKNKNFDHIITNPPFYKKNAGTRSAILDKDLSLREHLNLNEWVKISAKRLRPGGMFTIIVGTERLPDIINEATNYFGNIRVKPISSKINEKSNRVIIQMTKGVNGVFSLQPPLIVHQDKAIQKNSKCFTNDVRNILENSFALKI
jgi:tRNA1(Val) A37 N6-methylase TrmN6